MKVISKSPYVKVGDLKKILSDLPDDLEILVRRIGGIGNVSEIGSVSKSSYGFFGTSIDCLILDNKGEPASRSENDNDIELFEWEDKE